MEKSYRKPQYDPFETFKPSKALINESLRTMKVRCYEIIKEKQNLPASWLGEIVLEQLDAEHTVLLSRIKSYQYRLREHKKTGTYRPQEGSISHSDIERAKQYPIYQMYPEKLRMVGKRMTGKCPFHPDKSPSLVIYENNTYHCFGCQEDGDSISFAMKMQNLNFKQAIKYINQCH